MSNIFANGNYYYAGSDFTSENYNLSLPYMLNRVKRPTQDERLYYQQFTWNQAMIDCKTPDVMVKWCKPIIQGYV